MLKDIEALLEGTGITVVLDRNGYYMFTGCGRHLYDTTHWGSARTFASGVACGKEAADASGNPDT